MSRDDFLITEAMIMHGGSFLKKLAEAYRVADPDNQARIRCTWAGYWVAYAARAQHLLATDSDFARRVGDEPAIRELEEVEP
jgi:hypothetical protein